LKQLSQEEISELSLAKDLRARARTSISFADNHLGNAERLTNASQFDEASDELGRYQSVFEEAFHYLDNLHDKGNRTRDAYKRMELALREHVSRIETIRRSTPVEYAVNIKHLGEFVRAAREHALNSFYGETVLREQAPEQKNKNSEHDKSPTGNFGPKLP